MSRGSLAGFSESDGDSNNSRVVVHRGTIASGELVIKNGLLRDRPAEQHNVLCFEMVAVGDLTRCACLVIRGISHYCDSHKNNDWHGSRRHQQQHTEGNFFFTYHMYY